MMLGSQSLHSEKNLDRHLDYIICCVLYTKIISKCINELDAKTTTTTNHASKQSCKATILGSKKKYLKIILDLQRSAKIVQRVFVYLSPRFP